LLAQKKKFPHNLPLYLKNNDITGDEYFVNKVVNCVFFFKILTPLHKFEVKPLESHGLL